MSAELAARRTAAAAALADWKTDDRQYALEQIDDIVNRGKL